MNVNDDLPHNVVRLRDFYLQRLTRDAAQPATDVLAEVLPLAEFAKQGEPRVANADPYAGCHCPDGVDGLPAVFPDWDVG